MKKHIHLFTGVAFLLFTAEKCQPVRSTPAYGNTSQTEQATPVQTEPVGSTINGEFLATDSSQVAAPPSENELVVDNQRGQTQETAVLVADDRQVVEAPKDVVIEKGDKDELTASHQDGDGGMMADTSEIQLTDQDGNGGMVADTAEIQLSNQDGRGGITTEPAQVQVMNRGDRNSTTTQPANIQVANTDAKNSTLDTNMAYIQIQEGFAIPDQNDAFTLDSATIAGDILTIYVSYSGGCEDHDFELFAGTDYLKSMPVQLDVFIKHDSHGDMCRALLMRSYQFNIAEIRYSGFNEVILRFNKNEISVPYTY